MAMFTRFFRPGRQGRDQSAQVSTVMLSECQFSVVDVETTGLFPAAHDRVVEVAVVRVDYAGQRKDEFATLVNPDRDLGPTHIHGILAKDVADAPRFAEIAGDLAARLSGNVFVAHNAHFDLSFLEAEFSRIGHPLPAITSLCTMNLARRLGADSPAYNLAALCKHFDLALRPSHAALDDARATAALLGVLLRQPPARRWRTLSDLGCTLQPANAATWPQLPTNGKMCTRQESVNRAKPSYLARLADKIGPGSLHGAIESLEYVDLLNRVLEDRRVTAEEAGALLAAAGRLGLSADDVRRAHRSYLQALALAAVQDGIVTDAEKRDLNDVAELLGYDAETLNSAIESALAAHRGLPSSREQELSSRESFVGMTVCFTGESRCMIQGAPISRVRAEELAREAGLVIKSSVTKNLQLLVVADPDSLSGKARKAHDYGIRVVAEPVFWQILGIDVS